jgi:hypothetical protein
MRSLFFSMANFIGHPESHPGSDRYANPAALVDGPIVRPFAFEFRGWRATEQRR